MGCSICLRWRKLRPRQQGCNPGVRKPEQDTQELEDGQESWAGNLIPRIYSGNSEAL